MRGELLEHIVVIGGRGLFHVDPATFDARFLRDPLEVSLQELCNLLACEECYGNGEGLAGRGLDLQRVGVLNLLRFNTHGHLCLVIDNVAKSAFSIDSVARKFERILALLVVNIRVRS